MCNNKKTKVYRLNPGEKLPDDMKTKLNSINKSYTETRKFSNYVENLEKLFDCPPVQVTEDMKRFLGGFMEGEASINVSAKKLKTAQFGILIDPEFSITQHVNGVSTLLLALNVFQTGRIRYKEGSNATLVFIIHNRKSLTDKVIPFYDDYVSPFGSYWKNQRKEQFTKVLQLLSDGKHKQLDALLNELLPLWDSMRMQKGQSNETFANLESAQQYVTNFVKAKK